MRAPPSANFGSICLQLNDIFGTMFSKGRVNILGGLQPLVPKVFPCSSQKSELCQQPQGVHLLLWYPIMLTEPF